MGNSITHNFNTNGQQNLLVTCFFSRHEQKLLQPIVERRQELLDQLYWTEIFSRGIFIACLSPLLMNTRLGAISKRAQIKAMKQKSKIAATQQLPAGEKIK